MPSDNLTNRILAAAALAKANRASEDIETSNTSVNNKLESVYLTIGVTFNGDTVDQIQIVDRVNELELVKHTHSNKSVLDNLTQEMIDEIATLRQEVDVLKSAP